MIILSLMDNIKKLVKEELEAVNNELSNIFVQPDNLNRSLQGFLAGSSKRIRTIVTALYLKASGYKISHGSLEIITAGEIIHNASLLHDDVLDNASRRRGETTLAENFSPLVSILSGDFLLSIAVGKLLNTGNTDVLKIFLNCTKQMCQAELKQFFLRGKNPSISEYMEICEGKTALLFQAILRSALIIEGGNPDRASDFTRHFGILFQLKNDLTESSVASDKENLIYTPKDFLGIEKTKNLMDNYLEEVRGDIGFLPDNIYRKGLEDLITTL